MNGRPGVHPTVDSRSRYGDDVRRRGPRAAAALGPMVEAINHTVTAVNNRAAAAIDEPGPCTLTLCRCRSDLSG